MGYREFCGGRREVSCERIFGLLGLKKSGDFIVKFRFFVFF